MSAALLSRRTDIDQARPDLALWRDTFDADSRANYTYLIGAAGNLAVAGSRLEPAAVGDKEFVPTALAALADAVVVAHFAWGSGRFYSGVIGKALDANNFVQAITNSDAPGHADIYKRVGGVYTLLGSSAGGTIASLPSEHWFVGVTHGDAFTLYRFAADPVLGGAPAFKLGPVSIAGALGAGVAGKPGLSIDNLDNNDAWFEDLVIWAYGNQPFALP